MPTLVLASASPARAAVLRAAGIEPLVLVSGVEEPPVTGTSTAYVSGLAAAKARAVRGVAPAGTYVLGCDSMLELDGELLGKPGTAEVALARWQQMRGCSGTLLTGHCLLAGDAEMSEVGATVVRFGSPTDEELSAYIATGEPLQVAGAFTLDGRSAAFVEGIDGCPGNVIGLSMPVLRRLLARAGTAVHELWA